MTNISNFINQYNQRCFIIGNGPSLSKMDLSLLKDEILFGVNRGYRALDLKKIPHLNFLVVGDPTFFQSYNSEILNYNINPTFVKDSCDSTQEFQNFIKFQSSKKDLYLNKSLDKNDINPTIYKGRTVTLDAAQLAFHFGFTEIYFIGCDCDYTNGEHFYQESQKNWVPMNNIDLVFKNYESLQKLLSMHGIIVKNAGVGGKLDCIERIDFISLFQHSN